MRDKVGLAPVTPQRGGWPIKQPMSSTSFPNWGLTGRVGRVVTLGLPVEDGTPYQRLRIELVEALAPQSEVRGLTTQLGTEVPAPNPISGNEGLRRRQNPGWGLGIFPGLVHQKRTFRPFE